MFENPEIFVTLIVIGGGLIGLGWRYLSTKWKWLRQQLDKTEFDELAIGAAQETYEEFVRDLKKQGKDGKLTSDEKKEAMKRAVGKFKDAAKEQAIPAASKLAVPVIKGLVEMGINKLKGSAKEAKSEK